LAFKKADEKVEVKPLNIQTVDIPIEGTTELIMHRFSSKAKKMMLDKQMKKSVTREAKVPEEDYEETIYRFADGSIGFPAGAFKAAIVGACRMFKGLPMTTAKIAIFVEGEPGLDGVPLVRITGEPRMREDMVRLETGVADIRHRAGFPKWNTVVRVTFNADIISQEQLFNLVNAAGYGGIGEWRPSAPKSASGSFGRFIIPGGKPVRGEA
jgi:hypothetical protein